MAYAPIAFTIPNYRDFSGYWLKAYEPGGTTTPKLMATDATAATTVAKFELDVDGFPNTSGGALIIPFIDGAYDLWAFPTEATADADDTANALRFAINITGGSGGGTSGSGGFFDPKDFGASSTVDSNTEIQATYDAADSVGGSVYLSQTYRSDESVNVYSVPTVGTGTLDFSNALTLSLSNACCSAIGTLTDLGAPSADIAKGAISITMVSAPSLVFGDVIFIGSTEQYTNARSSYKKGEAPIVLLVSGSQVDIYGSTADDYTAANTTIFKVSPVSPSFGEGVTILAPNFPLSIGIHIKNGRRVSIQCEVTGAGTKGVQLQQCVDSSIDKALLMEKRDTTDTTTGTEYGVVLANCERISISDSVLVGERHGSTTGGFDNDFVNDVVAFPCRYIRFTGNYVSNDTGLSSHLTGGAAVESFDLHGNSEFITVTGNTIVGGAILAGNNTVFSDNTIYGRNDNGNTLLRYTEMVGLDHVADSNIMVSTADTITDSNDVLFLSVPITHSNVVGIDSKNALRFGGTFQYTNNKGICRNDDIAANLKPNEITIRKDSTYTGENINFIVENNTFEMPNNAKLYSSGIRVLVLSNFTTTPTALDSFISRGNKYTGCGAETVDVEDDTTMFSVNEFISENNVIDARDQAGFSHLVRNPISYVYIDNNKINGVTSAPIIVSSANLTVKDTATLLDNLVVSNNKFTDSIKTGSSTSQKTMGIIQGFNEGIIENNTNFTASASNATNLFHIETYDTCNVWRSNNIETSGIDSYNLVYDALTTDNFNQTYKHWATAETGAFLIKIDDKKRISTSGGAYAITMPVSPPNDSEFNLLDVGSSLSTNNATLTYNGTHTIMGAAADYILDVDNVNYGFTLLGTDWRVNNG